MSATPQADDSIEIPVDDLETITMTRGELERIKSAEWAKARKQFQAKRDRQDAPQFLERLERLERIVANAFEGPAAPQTNPAAKGK